MGIYKITNKVNGKVYIGQTININWKLRIKQHFDSAERVWGIDAQNLIHRAIRKYGRDNFEYILLEDTRDKDKLDELEKYYIHKYKSADPKYGYNISYGGNSPSKSKAIREKISKAETGSKNHMYGTKGKYNHTSKPLKCLDDGKIFYSVTEAAEYYGIDFSYIASVCRGKRSAAHGKHFIYIDKNRYNEFKPKKLAYKPKRMHQVTLVNTGKNYNSITEAYRDFKGIDEPRDSIFNHYKLFNGYFYDDYTGIAIRDINLSFSFEDIKVSTLRYINNIYCKETDTYYLSVYKLLRELGYNHAEAARLRRGVSKELNNKGFTTLQGIKYYSLHDEKLVLTGKA